jgi:hypothetical protein
MPCLKKLGEKELPCAAKTARTGKQFNAKGGEEIWVIGDS